MPEITLGGGYIEVSIAHFYRMTPGEFSLLDWDEQAKLIAYYHVKSKIDQYYQEWHEMKAKAMRESK